MVKRSASPRSVQDYKTSSILAFLDDAQGYALNVPESISEAEPPLLSVNRRSGMVTRSLLIASFLTASSIAILLRQQGAVQPKEAQAKEVAVRHNAEEVIIKEIAEFEEGTNLIGHVFFIEHEKDGEKMRIPVCIQRDTQTNDLLFHIDGKVFHNDETIPMLGGKATDVIESITSHNGECVRLASEANGHVDVPYALIRTIVPQLAHTTQTEVVAHTNVTFVPKEGTMMSGGQTAMNWIGQQFGQKQAADMSIKSVTFKQIPMGRPHHQMASIKK